MTYIRIEIDEEIKELMTVIITIAIITVINRDISVSLVLQMEIMIWILAASITKIIIKRSLIIRL